MPRRGRGNLMFPQRNNPYCELLSFYATNLYKKTLITKKIFHIFGKIFQQMKKILGLDLGTNSIGWAVVNVDDHNAPCSISTAGSRIIPMGEDALSNFNSGKTSKNSSVKSPAAQRTDYRGVRRLRERNLLRRERRIFDTSPLEKII